MNMQEMKEQFMELVDEVINTKNLSVESAIEVASVIFQEVGKDRRAEMLAEARNNGFRDYNEGPTEKQLKYLKRLGVEIPTGITRKEASALIDEAKNN